MPFETAIATLPEPAPVSTSEDLGNWLPLPQEPAIPAGEFRVIQGALDGDLRQQDPEAYRAWRQLYEQHSDAHPFQHPDVVLQPDDGHTTRSAQWVRVYHQHRLAGVAVLRPKTVRLQRLGGVLPIGLRHGHSVPGGAFLAEDARDPGVTSTLLSQVLQLLVQQGSHFLVVDDVDDTSPLAKLLTRELPTGWSLYRHAGVQPRHRIELPATSEAYWKTFSAKTRQTFRRKLKKFGRTHLERIESPEQVEHFLTHAHAISRQTWQTRQFGLRIRNDAAERSQLEALARLGLLRSYLWSVEDQPVAFTLGVQDHGCFHYEEVGYLQDVARYSPGQMMLIQMIDDMFAHRRPDLFDFGGGDADYKRLFANRSTQSGTIWLFPPTLCGRWTCSYLTTSQRARRWVRERIDRSGWTTRLRQWVRYGKGSAGTAHASTTDDQHAHPASDA